MNTIYFVPANSIAPISGVVQTVRERLETVGRVVSATTDPATNEGLVCESDAVCVMVPRHGKTTIAVGRGVFEAVETAMDDEGSSSDAYLIDPDTLELFKVASFSKSGQNFRAWGTLTLSQRTPSRAGHISESIRMALMRTSPPWCDSDKIDDIKVKKRPMGESEKRTSGLGYLSLALHLGIVSVRT